MNLEKKIYFFGNYFLKNCSKSRKKTSKKLLSGLTSYFDDFERLWASTGKPCQAAGPCTRLKNGRQKRKGQNCPGKSISMSSLTIRIKNSDFQNFDDSPLHNILIKLIKSLTSYSPLSNCKTIGFWLDIGCSTFVRKVKR